MKKLVAMLALGLTLVGSAYAQDAPQREKRESQKGQYGQERKERKNKDAFGRNAERRDKLTLEQRATKRTEKVSQQLDLNSKQKSKLQELNLKQAQQMEAIATQRTNANNVKGANRQEMQSLHANYEKELKSILTKKQYAKYEEDRKQLQAQRRNRSGKEGESNSRTRRPLEN
jgi:hypothetical protein